VRGSVSIANAKKKIGVSRASLDNALEKESGPESFDPTTLTIARAKKASVRS
jgi:DNA-binding phage protein